VAGRRALAVLVAAAALLAGCGSRAAIREGGAVVGDTLTVYSVLPRPQEGAARDIADGQKLALRDAGGRVGAFAVSFALLDAAAREPGRRQAAAAEATREAIADPQVIAVVGGLDSLAARVSASLLNAAGILLVSPGAGDPGLTCAIAPGLPERHQPAGIPAFARLGGDDRALAAAMLRAAGPGRVAVEAEPGEDATRLAAILRAAAGSRLVAEAARARAVLYAGEDPANAAGVADALVAEAPAARVVLGDDLVRAGVAGALGPAARRRAVLVSRAPTLDASPALRAFARRFRAAFGREPGPYAALGYEAMQAVLDALRRAGADASRRRAVIDAFLAGRAREGLLGPLRIAPTGAAEPARFTVTARGRARELVVPAPPCDGAEAR